MGFNKNLVNKRKLVSLLLVLIFCFSSSLYAMSRKPKPYRPETFLIHMTVDFGPAGKPGYSEEMAVEKDTTAKEAVSQVYPVLSGPVCCSLRDVLQIDGVRVDSEKKLWWYGLRNGSQNFSPSRDKLKAGDKIEWRYVEGKITPQGKT